MWLMESPLIIGVLGTALTVMVASGWTTTGNRYVGLGAVLLALLTVGMVVLERYVETDREIVSNLVHQLADKAEQGDVAGLLEHVHPRGTQVRERIERDMSTWEFTKVEIKRNLRVTPELNHQPPRVVATFNVLIGADLGPNALRDEGIVYCEVIFYRDGEQWKVRDAIVERDLRKAFR